MQKNNLPYKTFIVLFVVGWLVGLGMAPLFNPSSTSAATTPSISIGITTPNEQLSSWGKFKNSFLDFWFSIPDAIRLRRPNFNYPTNLPTGIAQKIQEICQQEKQAMTEYINHQNEIASQLAAQFEKDAAKNTADAIKTMDNSTKQTAAFYRKNGYETYAQNLEKSQQYYDSEYQKMADFQREERDKARQTMREFWQSYLETRFPC